MNLSYREADILDRFERLNPTLMAVNFRYVEFKRIEITSIRPDDNHFTEASQEKSEYLEKVITFVSPGIYMNSEGVLSYNASSPQVYILSLIESIAKYGDPRIDVSDRHISSKNDRFTFRVLVK